MIPQLRYAAPPRAGCNNPLVPGAQRSPRNEAATPAKALKRLVSRFYQMKTGHALTGKYLKHIGSRESNACWWCGRPGASQTREHLFKSCPA